MDESTHDDDRQIVQEIASRFDAPAYVRRAKLVETSWSNVLEQTGKLRLEQLKIVSLRLGQLLALAGDWDALGTLLANGEDRVALQQLYQELRPRLRVPLQATTSSRTLSVAGRRLVEAMRAFNQRWPKLLAKINLQPINAARDAYNRYYLIEKECAVRSTVLAGIDFHPMEPATLDHFRKLFPLLKPPSFVA